VLVGLLAVHVTASVVLFFKNALCCVAVGRCSSVVWEWLSGCRQYA